MESNGAKFDNGYLNQLSIFRKLYYCNSPLTQKELSSKTGLSIPTVAKALKGLGTTGLVKDKGLKDIPTGRKPTIYGLNNTSVYGLGVDLEIPDLRIAVYDLSRRMVANKGTYLDISKVRSDSLNYIPDRISEEYLELTEHEQLPRQSIVGAGLAAPGLVKDGEFRPFSRFTDAKKVNLEQALQERLDIPVSLGNDIDLQLMSELDRLGLVNKSDEVVLYFGARVSGKRRPVIRIGGSVAIGGSIFRGAWGSAGEFGHMSVSPEHEIDLPQTFCGNDNCLESFVNSKIARTDGSHVPEVIKDLIEQKIQDLIFAFSPSVIVIDLAAFPEITEEIIKELSEFVNELKTTVGIGDIKVREILDHDRSATRGSFIHHFNKLVRDPESFSTLVGSSGKVSS